MVSLVAVLGENWSPPPPVLIDPPEIQLYKAIQDAGLTPPDEIYLDGVLRRFRSGSKGEPGHGDKPGWYVAFGGPVPAGRFGDWRAGVEHSWRADIGRTLSISEEAANSRRMSEARLRRDEELKKSREVAADTVERIWDGCTFSLPEHPYLARKGIQPNGARLTGDGRLVVPLFDSDGVLSSLQYISADGQKIYHSGGKTGGCFWWIGAVESSQTIYIAEGFATASTISEVTGKPCVVAYSASNLVPVCGTIKARFPDAKIIVVADHDASGVGQKYADQCCAKFGVKSVMPPTQGDANDYHIAGNDLLMLLDPPMKGIFDKVRALYASELSTEYSPPDELIENLIVCGSMTVIYGDSNSGKTFFALAMAAAVAEGLPFFGRRTDPGVVIYLATESPASVIRRIQALQNYLNLRLTNLVIVQCPINFYTGDGDANDVIELVQQVAKDRVLPVRLIIGDTLARMSSGANENSGEDMAPVMARFDRVAHSCNAALLAIHHNGKNAAAGARGWSGIRAHIDTEIEITSDDVTRCASVTKQRELGGKGDEIFFRLETVPLGTGKFGTPASTCIALPDDAAGRQAPQKKPSKYKEASDILERAWWKGGAELLNGAPYVSRSILREMLIGDGMTERTAKNKTEANRSDGYIMPMLNTGALQTSGHGWIFTNDIQASAMLLRKSGQ